jgi:hypothetical protein
LQLLAVDQGQLRYIDSKLRSPVAVTALLYKRDTASLRLSTARYNPSIHNDGLIQDGAETIPGHVTISRDPFVNTHSNNRPRGHGQRLRKHRLTWLSLGLSIGLALRLSGRLRFRKSARLPLGLRIWGWDISLDFPRLIRLILLSSSG